MADAAFESVASDYDRTFTDTWAGRVMREQVHRHLAGLFGPGDHVLDLGCGTGEDAVRLARRGVQVTGVDASEAMLAVARGKAREQGMDDRIVLAQADVADSGLAALRQDAGQMPHLFDGALANFGVLNCVQDRRSLAADLADLLRPGARLVVVVMGPLCLGELAWFLLHGKARTAMRRWRGGDVASVGHDNGVPAWYPGPRRIRREFESSFMLRRRAGVGAMLTPAAWGSGSAPRPRVAALLRAADDRLSSVPVSAWVADHHLAVLERR